jgi:hypothetical protein
VARPRAWTEVVLAEMASEDGDHDAAEIHLCTARHVFLATHERAGLRHCTRAVPVRRAG